jgi:HD-like signal output (HDOD) protein
MLLEEGVVTPAQLSEAFSAAETGGHILPHLVHAGHLTQGDLHEFLSKQPGVAGIDIAQYNIERGLAQLIPAEMARERMVMPIDALGKLLTVAMACPLDTATIAEVEAFTGRRVKAMLCRWRDLADAIEKHYPAGYADEETGEASFANFNIPAAPTGRKTAPAKSDTVEQIRALETLALPASALERCDALWSGDAPSVVDVCDFVCEEPSLAAGALRAANAEAFGLRHKVGSIALACSVLGVDTVRAIAMEAGIAKGRLDLNALTQQAVLCARAAEEIARACGRSDIGRSYTAGLLHAVGRAVFSQIDPVFYGSVSGNLTKAETGHFGFSFAEAGYELLHAWGLPPEITGPIRDQLNPASSEAHRDTAAVVACARALAAAHLANGPNPALDGATKPFFEIVGLDPAVAGTILSGIGQAA